MSLLEVSELKKSFVTNRDLLGRPIGKVNAVRGMTLSLDAGETLAVVGESGSGKSTLARLVLRLIEPDSGTITFDGKTVTDFDRREMRQYRQQAQMIFQDPFTSLDPRMTIADQVGEPLLVHGLAANREERRERVRELLDQVGIAEHQLNRYPQEFSGGQLQRVAIARALATNPKILICDEPVAALDMSIRAQVINLLQDLQRDRGIALMFITHDLSLVKLIAHRVAVMFRGDLLEQGAIESVFCDPKESYTKSLLDAVPVANPRRRRFAAQLSQTQPAGQC